MWRLGQARRYLNRLMELRPGSFKRADLKLLAQILSFLFADNSPTDALFHRRYCLEPPPSDRHSAWICSHERTMSCCRRPVVNPLPPNAVGLLDELATRALPVLNYNDEPGVKFSLGVINIG